MEYHGIQVFWKSIEEKEKHKIELLNLLYAFGEKTIELKPLHTIVTLRSPCAGNHKEFLKKIEAIYSEFMKTFKNEDFVWYSKWHEEMYGFKPF